MVEFKTSVGSVKSYVNTLTKISILFKETVDPYLKLHKENQENNPEKAEAAIKLMENIFNLLDEWDTSFSKLK